MFSESFQSIEIGTHGLSAGEVKDEVYHSGNNVSRQHCGGSMVDVCLVCLSDKNTRVTGAVGANRVHGPGSM